MESLQPLSTECGHFPAPIWLKASGHFAVQFYRSSLDRGLTLRALFLANGPGQLEKTYHIDVSIEEKVDCDGLCQMTGKFGNFDLGFVRRLENEQFDFTPFAAIAGPEGRSFTTSHLRDFRKAWRVNVLHHFKKCFCNKQLPGLPSLLEIQPTCETLPNQKHINGFVGPASTTSTFIPLLDFLWHFFGHLSDEIRNGNVEKFIASRLMRYRQPLINIKTPRKSPEVPPSP